MRLRSKRLTEPPRKRSRDQSTTSSTMLSGHGAPNDNNNDSTNVTVNNSSRRSHHSTSNTVHNTSSDSCGTATTSSIATSTTSGAVSSNANNNNYSNIKTTNINNNHNNNNNNNNVTLMPAHSHGGATASHSGVSAGAGGQIIVTKSASGCSNVHPAIASTSMHVPHPSNTCGVNTSLSSSTSASHISCSGIASTSSTLNQNVLSGPSTSKHPSSSALNSLTSAHSALGTPPCSGSTSSSLYTNTNQTGQSNISTIPSFAAVSMVTNDNDSEEIEMSRLQALLESRGVPSHLLGALGPKVHTLLHRTINSSTSSKAHQLVQGLQSHGDEGQQLQSVMEMCQLLVMGNEDTLTGFPIKLAVPNLIQLLNMEHNFDIMNHACRALTYMMESLPRSASVVIDAVPSFLDKLQSIQCMDVAEQSLTALEMLSRRHSRAILHAHGVSACLTYLDFFSINAQRSALAIAANCCQNVTPEEFIYIKDSLVTLSTHLTSTDKKCVESICLAFSRLIEHYQNEQAILTAVAGGSLIENLIQLLLASPSIISANTFVMIIRMLALMCQNSSELSVRMLSSDIVSTIRYLLVGQRNNKFNSSTSHRSTLSEVSGSANSSSTSITNSSFVINSPTKLNESVELLNRSPQELHEITSLIAELMPKLPSDGIFSIDSIISKETNPSFKSIIWQWRDDRGVWHRYNTADNKLIDTAHRAGDEEVSLVTMGKTYTIDFTTMQQINEETEASRPIQRKLNYMPTTSNQSHKPSSSPSANDISKDPKVLYLKLNPSVLENFAQSLIGVLYEIYSSSAGPSVRHKCLHALFRVIYYTPTKSLSSLLNMHPVSSHIAAMLSSSDQKILVGAIQMATILMDRLPEVFSVYFRREGVMYQFSKLAKSSKTISPPNSSKEKIEEWVLKHSQNFEEKFLKPEELSRCNSSSASIGNNTPIKDSHPAMDTINKLTTSLELLDNKKTVIEGLRKLKAIIADGDISSFELIHGGLISKLTKFLISSDASSLNDCDYKFRDNRIRAFLSVFLGIPQDPKNLLLFLNEQELKINPTAFLALTSKLNACISQLEQFPVRVHDFVGTGVGSTRGQSTLKFFNTHQIKCHLQRHPNCDELRQWRGGPVKIDPLAMIQAIEKYLTVRGYAKIRDSADNSEDNNSDDDMDQESMTMIAPTNGRSRLQLSIGDNVLPCNMTVYQAIRQYGGRVSRSHELGTDSEEIDAHLSAHNIWSETHTIYYRPCPETPCQAQQPTSMIPGSSASNQRASVYVAKHNSTGAPVSPSGSVSNPTLNPISSSGASDLRLNPVTYQNPSEFSSSSQHQQISGPSCSSSGHSHSVPSSTKHFMPTSSGMSRRHSSRSSSSIYSQSHMNRGNLTKRKEEALVDNKPTLPNFNSPVDEYFVPGVSCPMTVKDPSLDMIFLLRALFGLNRFWPWFYKDYISFKTSHIISSSEFLNNKLAAKVMRQLQDPLVIMTGNLPEWINQICYNNPFLIPFETRQLLFYVSCFDRDRALLRLMDATPELAQSEDRVTPRLDRRKKTISRDDLYKQAETILNETQNNRTILEIQYENEVGTGLGPTLEFYALMSRELQSVDFEMWRPSVPTAVEHQKKKYVNSANGLFPQPLSKVNGKTHSKIKSRYKLLGRFMARALMDSRVIDIPLSLPFYKWLLSSERGPTMDLSDMVDIDSTTARHLFDMHRIAQIHHIMVNNQRSKPGDSKSGTKITTAKSLDKLRQQLANGCADIPKTDDIFTNISPEVLTLNGCPIEDLNLDFTLPGYSSIELKKGGKDTTTKLDNLSEYVRLFKHWTLVEGVKKQMDSFKAGFDSVVPLHHVRLFYPEELDSLFCGSGYQCWDTRMLMEACKTDHGFTHESIQIKYLFEILSSYDADQQRKFLQFITGSPRLPHGGLKSLSPPLTIVRKTLEPGQNPDHFLPSVMTCVNYLKLPEYSSCKIMKEKLQISAEEGRNCFHLS